MQLDRGIDSVARSGKPNVHDGEFRLLRSGECQRLIRCCGYSDLVVSGLVQAMLELKRNEIIVFDETV